MQNDLKSLRVGDVVMVQRDRGRVLGRVWEETTVTKVGRDYFYVDTGSWREQHYARKPEFPTYSGARTPSYHEHMHTVREPLMERLKRILDRTHGVYAWHEKLTTDQLQRIAAILDEKAEG